MCQLCDKSEIQPTDKDRIGPHTVWRLLVANFIIQTHEIHGMLTFFDDASRLLQSHTSTSSSAHTFSYHTQWVKDVYPCQARKDTVFLERVWWLKLLLKLWSENTRKKRERERKGNHNRGLQQCLYHIIHTSYMWFETLESLINQSDETQFDFQEPKIGVFTCTASQEPPRRPARSRTPGGAAQNLHAPSSRPPEAPPPTQQQGGGEGGTGNGRERQGEN